jgi:hypothetical protein
MNFNQTAAAATICNPELVESPAGKSAQSCQALHAPGIHALERAAPAVSAKDAAQSHETHYTLSKPIAPPEELQN